MAYAPKPVTRPTRARGRHLRLIPGGQQTRKATGARPARRPAIGFVLAAGAVVAAFVFGLVLLHVVLAQSAFRLQNLSKQVAEEESRNRQMRYEVATAEAPERMADAAASIGLVVPDQQRYLLAP